jgi:hypothetical protein
LALGFACQSGGNSPAGKTDSSCFRRGRICRIYKKSGKITSRKKTYEFYVSANDFLGKIREIRRKEKNWSERPDEEITAMEWLFYLTIPLPLLSTEEYLQRTKNADRDDKGVDVSIKSDILKEMNRPIFFQGEAIRKRIATAYLAENGKEADEEFLKNAVEKTKVNGIMQHIALLKFLREEKEKAVIEEKRVHSTGF